MSQELLVTAKEASRAVGMSAHSLYHLARARRVPSYAAGPKLSGIRFSISELREALRRPARSPHANAAIVVVRKVETENKPED
jgi:hypothetical protein